jgi:outer membrane receptor protein involved in Fe transport
LKQLSVEELMDIEVTSVSKRLEKLSEAPAAIQVITGEEIRRSGASSIPEALRLAETLDVSQKNAHEWVISARGFSSDVGNKLLVLIDGRTVYTPLFSGVFWDRQDYLLEDIDRIEVISGPGGTLWGANAVNGVINIVTKDAGDSQGALLDATVGTADMKVMGRYGFSPWEGGALRLYAQASHANDASPLSALDTSRTGWARNQGGFRLDQKLDSDAVTLQGDVYANSTPATDSKRNRGYDLTGRWTRDLASGSSLLGANRIRPLLVTSAQRVNIPGLKEVPALAESGLKGMEIDQWWALVAPATTPLELIERLRREAIAALDHASVKERMAVLGVQLKGSTTGELRAFMRSEAERWQKVAHGIGLQPQ